MAKSDDTSKARSGRNQPKGSTSASGSSPPTNSTPTAAPRTLEQAIEYERALLLQVHAMLHCLYEVLLYADDDDAITHAEVAHAAARFINESVARLDLVSLRPLIEAIQNGTEQSSEDEQDSISRSHYQVREPMPVYLS